MPRIANQRSVSARRSHGPVESAFQSASLEAFAPRSSDAGDRGGDDRWLSALTRNFPSRSLSSVPRCSDKRRSWRRSVDKPSNNFCSKMIRSLERARLGRRKLTHQFVSHSMKYIQCTIVANEICLIFISLTRHRKKVKGGLLPRESHGYERGHL